MIGLVTVNPEVWIARVLERGGRAAPGLDFIRWRLAQLRLEVADDAEFWGIPARDIAASRAAQLAEARGVYRSVPRVSARLSGSEDRILSISTKVEQ